MRTPAARWTWLWWTIGTIGIVAVLHSIGWLHYVECPNDIDGSPRPALQEIFERSVDVGVTDVRVEGEYRNVLDTVVRGVRIDIRWYDDHGLDFNHPDLNVVASKWTTFDADPIMPGQTARFAAEFPRVPSMATHYVDFKTSWGCMMVIVGPEPKPGPTAPAIRNK